MCEHASTLMIIDTWKSHFHESSPPQILFVVGVRDGHPHENNVATRFASVFSWRFFVVFRESSPSRMDFVSQVISWEFTVTIGFRESLVISWEFTFTNGFHESLVISWEFTITDWFRESLIFSWEHHHENKLFHESNHHENYPTRASQSKFQLHIYGPNVNTTHTHTNTHTHRDIYIPISTQLSNHYNKGS